MTRHIPLRPAHAWTFALLPDLLTEFDIEPRQVVHLGAHHGEEVAIYRQCGFTDIVLVEPAPAQLSVLHGKFDDLDHIHIVEAAAVPGTGAGHAELHLAPRTVLNGLIAHPTATGQRITVPTIGLDTLLTAETTLLVIDTQGTELELLRAVDLTAPRLRLIIVETSRRPDDGAADYDAAVQYMSGHGWEAIEEWIHDGSGFTDTVFLAP